MMNKLNFDLLLTLIAVAESKNFSEAATKLKITQASISHKMKELETLLPTPIFYLEGKRKKLTHFGHALYEVAKQQNINLENELENINRIYTTPKLLNLRIGGRPELIDFILPDIKFTGRIDLISTSSQEAINKLLKNEIDIAITHIVPDSTELIAKKIIQSSGQLIVHKDFTTKLKNQNNILKDSNFLTTTPLILFEKEGHIFKDWLIKSKLELADFNIKYISNDWKIIEKLVQNGLGLAFVPHYIGSTSKDVLKFDLPNLDMPKITFYLVYNKGLKKIQAFKNIF